MKPRPIIDNPNSSGQGHHAEGPGHFLADVATPFGYTYSHSTPIGCIDGENWYLLHTFRHSGGHTLSLRSGHAHPEIWDTSCGAASGRRWTGKGKPELIAHLKRKAHRYSLRKP